MARSFNGSTDKAVNATGIVTAAPLTMACWFKPVNFTGNPIMMCLDDGSNANKFQLQADASHVYAQAQGGFAQTSTAPATGSWQHACAVFTSATSRAAYLQGGGKGTDSTSATPAGINNFDLANKAGTNFLNGNLAEAALWNAALNDSEVAALAGGVLAFRVRPSALVAYWPLWGFASPEVDLSGSKFNLTLTGTAQVNHAPVTLFTNKARTPCDTPAAVANVLRLLALVGIGQ